MKKILDQWEARAVKTGYEADYAELDSTNEDKILKLIAVIRKQDEALKFYGQKPKDDTGSTFAKSLHAFESMMGNDGFSRPMTWDPLLDLGDKARQTREEVEKILNEN